MKEFEARKQSTNFQIELLSEETTNNAINYGWKSAPISITNVLKPEVAEKFTKERNKSYVKKKTNDPAKITEKFFSRVIAFGEFSLREAYKIACEK